MSIMGVEVHSNLDSRYTNLLKDKLSDYLKRIMGNTTNYNKYINYIEFNELKNNEEKIKSNYNRYLKAIKIEVDKNLPLVYESLYHEIQHAKNNSKSLFNINVASKYPFVYKFIDEYLAYSKTMEYMINYELIKNEKLVEWYREYIKASNQEMDSKIIENINFFRTLCIEEKFNSSNDILSYEEVNDAISNTAFTIAKINALKINDFDIRLSTLIMELDGLEAPITNKDCELIKTSLQIINELNI